MPKSDVKVFLVGKTGDKRSRIAMDAEANSQRLQGNEVIRIDSIPPEEAVSLGKRVEWYVRQVEAANQILFLASCYQEFVVDGRSKWDWSFLEAGLICQIALWYRKIPISTRLHGKGGHR